MITQFIFYFHAQAGNCQGKILAMKAIDYQPWRDAGLLPSL